MGKGNGHSALAHRATDPLRGAAAYIACREQPGNAGLQGKRVASQRPASGALTPFKQVGSGEDIFGGIRTDA